MDKIVHKKYAYILKPKEQWPSAFTTPALPQWFIQQHHNRDMPLLLKSVDLFENRDFGSRLCKDVILYPMKSYLLTRDGTYCKIYDVNTKEHVANAWVDTDQVFMFFEPNVAETLAIKVKDKEDERDCCNI